MKVKGDYNTADVKTESGEDEAIDQIQSMVDAEAFEGDEDVAIMPDFHFGSGAVIGFTMPFKDRVAPATVGVDIGCGMTAIRLNGNPELEDWDLREEVDEAVRERVPVGFDVHNRSDYHMVDDFPWEVCATKLSEFEKTTGFDLGGDKPPTFDGTDIPLYGKEYFIDLLKRVEYDSTRAINSVGTLGGGNHFIEIGEDPDAVENPYWAVIHSGSRGLGASIAQYWIDRAGKIRNATDVRKHFRLLPKEYRKYLKFDVDGVSDEDLLDWVQGGMGEDYVAYELLKDEYKETDPERIGEISTALKDALNVIKTGEDPTAYLEEEEAHGYIVDMVFAQTYAQESRKQMAKAVEDAWKELGLTAKDMASRDFIESVHNYIDFRDATIRKGACRAHEDERVIIPFNMKYGTLICKGKGDEDWNNSAPHGAGRAMSRTGAKQKFEQDNFENEMADAGVYLSKHPLDEAPGAYKDPETIEDAIGPTVEVKRRVKPLISIKAE